MNADEIKIDNEIALAEFIRDVRKQWHESKYLLVRVRTGKQRTLTQNKALHLWLQMVADELNAHGLDMRRVMKEEFDIPWTMESAKENLFKPLLDALTKKESTTEADRQEYSYVRDVMANHFATKHGITLPEWPKKKLDDEAA